MGWGFGGEMSGWGFGRYGKSGRWD